MAGNDGGHKPRQQESDAQEGEAAQARSVERQCNDQAEQELRGYADADKHEGIAD